MQSDFRIVEQMTTSWKDVWGRWCRLWSEREEIRTDDSVSEESGSRCHLYREKQINKDTKTDDNIILVDADALYKEKTAVHDKWHCNRKRITDSPIFPGKVDSAFWFSCTNWMCWCRGRLLLYSTPHRNENQYGGPAVPHTGSTSSNIGPTLAAP